MMKSPKKQKKRETWATKYTAERSAVYRLRAESGRLCHLVPHPLGTCLWDDSEVLPMYLPLDAVKVLRTEFGAADPF